MSSTPSIDDAIASVERWSSDEAARQKAELAEVEQEMVGLRKAVENLNEQLAALVSFKTELESRGGDISGEKLRRSHDAIFEALTAQAASMASRAAIVTEAEGARAAGLGNALSGSDVSAELAEYKQFKEQVEPTLSALPESYRTAMLEHHENNVVAKLRDTINAAMAGPVEVDAEPITVQAAYAVDTFEGNPELLVVVLPVEEATYSDWRNRDEDLQTALAARVAQAVHLAAHDVDHPVHVTLGGHRGLLALEVLLEGAPKKVIDAFKTQLDAVLERAPELAAAKVTATAQPVSIDFLVPPDEDDEVAPVSSSSGQEAADAG